ncbi:MAG: type II toxin-antitoxin system RelE/ParE family toxin [Actinomycetota bacterium]
MQKTTCGGRPRDSSTWTTPSSRAEGNTEKGRPGAATGATRKLRELRFFLGPQSDAVRITYSIATGRRIILLTMFRKQRQRERAEIDWAARAMGKCIAEGHTVEDEHD